MRPRPWRQPALMVEPVAPPSVVAELLRSKLLEDGAAKWRATGASMRGAVADGTVVHLRPSDGDQLRRGDVVIAELPSGLAVHRVTRVVNGCVRLRGDARRRADPLIPVDAVIGAVEPAPPLRLRSFLYRLLP